MAASSTIPLSPMDAVMGPFGFSILYLYAPPPTNSPRFDLNQLELSFNAAVDQDYPYFVGELSVNPTNGEIGVLQEENAPRPEFIKDEQCQLTTEDALASLSLNLMPPARAKPQLMKIKCSLLADGGLAIGVDAAHCLFDGEGMFTFMQVWGQHCRGVPKADRIAVCLDHQLLAARGVGAKLDHPEFRVPEETSTATDSGSGDAPMGAPAATTPPPTKQRVFHLLPEKLAKLKDLVGGPSDAPDYSYVSTVDSLTALFLVLITRARGHGKDVRMTTGVNARRRFNPPLPANYAGNVIFNSFSSYSATELAPKEGDGEPSTESLRSIARRIRASILRRDEEFLRDAIEFIAQQRDMSAIQVGTNYFFGPDLMFTCHARMGMYDADFGGGKAVYASTPAFECLDGFVIFREAMCHQEGLEAVVFLEKAAMDRLDALWDSLTLWN